jgi:DNA-directed RNA polymerase alpha subunit
MTELSPAAYAIVAAAHQQGHTNRLGLAAALRAAADQVVPEPQKADNDDALIDLLHFSARTENALKRHAVFTLGDLRWFTYSDLLLLKGFGVASADEVVTSLASIGISLPGSAQARSLSWSDEVVRRATRAKILAIADELEEHR